MYYFHYNPITHALHCSHDTTTVTITIVSLVALMECLIQLTVAGVPANDPVIIALQCSVLINGVLELTFTIHNVSLIFIFTLKNSPFLICIPDLKCRLQVMIYSLKGYI